MRLILAILFLVFSFIFSLEILTEPSNDRLWNEDQKILPEVNFNKNFVTIKNIRNFSYNSPTEFTPWYYDKTFNLEKLKKVYYIVEPLKGIGAAHTFLSFEFEGDQFVSISVEVRKEVGESFSPLKGLLNQYELMYVIADERDVVKLRSNYRKDDVYVYPIKASEEKVRELFVDMLTRAKNLQENPEFYNTIYNTCTTNIVSHVNKISEKKIPLSLELIFPKNSDERAYELGLIDTNLPFVEAKERFKINTRAEKYKDSPNFSVKIREEEKNQ